MCLPTPSGSLSSALVFQCEEAKLSPRSPKWSLHVKHTPSSFAVCWRICFVSYLTEASSLCAEQAVPSREEAGGEGRDLRALLVFLANAEKCQN